MDVPLVVTHRVPGERRETATDASRAYTRRGQPMAQTRHAASEQERWSLDESPAYSVSKTAGTARAASPWCATRVSCYQAKSI